MQNVFMTDQTAAALAAVPFLNGRQMGILAEKSRLLWSFHEIDDNPTYIGGGLYACGPTTGEWLTANNLTEVGWWVVGGVRFTIAI